MGMLQSFTNSLSALVQKVFVDELINLDTVLSHQRAAQLAAYIPYRSYDADTELFANVDGWGFTLECSPLIGATQQTMDVLSNTLGAAVPDDVTLQFLSTSDGRIGSILEWWARARANAAPAFGSIVKNRVDHFKNAAWDGLSKSAHFHPRQHKVYISVSSRGFDDLDKPKALTEFRETLMAAFRQASGPVRNVGPAELIGLCAEILNPTLSVIPEPKLYDETVPINKQILRPDTSFAIYRDHIEASATRGAIQTSVISDNCEEDRLEIRAMEVRNFPRQSQLGVMSKALGDIFSNEIRHSSPVMVCLTVYYPKAEASKVSAEGKSMRATQVADGPGGKYMVVMQNRARDWRRAQTDIVAGARPIQVSMFVVVTSKVGEGRTAERNTRNVFQSFQTELRRCDAVHLPSLMLMLPMTGEGGLGRDARTLGRFKSHISNMVATVAPVWGEFRGTNSPSMLFLGRVGQPFCWDQFSSIGRGNMNAVCIGASGAGKSFLLNEMAMSHVAIGGHVLVVDDGRSFKNLCEVVQGRHYEFSIGEAFCLNSFDMIDETRCDPEHTNFDSDYLGERLETCRAIFAQMCLGDDRRTKEQNGVLMDIVARVWQTHGRLGGADEVADELRTMNYQSPTINTAAMSRAMLPYCSDGPYGAIFNGRNSLDLSNPFTVFELAPLEQKKDLRGIIVTALFALMDSKVTTDRSRRDLIILDEAWKLLGSATISDTLEGWARRLRKYGAGLTLGTQSLADFSSSKGAKSVLDNAEWTIIMKSRGSAMEQLGADKIFADKYSLKLAKDLRVSAGEYSECLIMCEEWYAPGRLIVDPFSAALYSTTADEVDAINNMRALGVDLEIAVALIPHFKKWVAIGLPPETALTKAVEVSHRLPSVHADGLSVSDALVLLTEEQTYVSP